MLLLDDVREYLIAQGVGGPASPADWPIYCGFFPADQDQMIGIFPTGGYPADTMLRENRRLTFQTRIRGREFSYAQVYAKWQQIFDALQDAQETSGSPKLLVGFAYIQAMQAGPLFFNDDLKRPNMTTNWIVMKSA